MAFATSIPNAKAMAEPTRYAAAKYRYAGTLLAAISGQSWVGWESNLGSDYHLLLAKRRTRKHRTVAMDAGVRRHDSGGARGRGAPQLPGWAAAMAMRRLA